MTDDVDLLFNEELLADLTHWLWSHFTKFLRSVDAEAYGVVISDERWKAWGDLHVPYSNLSREEQLKDLKLVKRWIEKSDFKQCPICYKLTKELIEIETDLRHQWITLNPEKGPDKKHADPQKVCGWCHDFILQNSPPEPGDDDTAYDLWAESAPDYPDYMEDGP